MKRKDVRGLRYGRLTIIDWVDEKPHLHVLCSCDCGNEKVIRITGLRNGNTVSCGCFNLERTTEVNTRHGKSHESIHNIWKGMNSRCNTPTCSTYKHYGARGIKICERWKSFENFYADMGDRPAGMTLERIDNSGNYEPSNCKWATHKEQMRNRRFNNVITYNGQTKCMSAWADELGIKIGTLWHRIEIAGWSIFRAFNEKVGGKEFAR